MTHVSLTTRLRALRWWWYVGIVWIAAYVTAWSIVTSIPGLRRWVFSTLPVALTPLLLGLAWLIVIAPMLESGVARFSDRWPARRRWQLCRVFAWVPTVIFALLLIQVTIVLAADIDHFGWFGRGYPVFAVAAFILSFFYGRLMSRHLKRRVLDAAARSESCFRCNYRLSGLRGPRCPECGHRFMPRVSRDARSSPRCRSPSRHASR